METSGLSLSPDFKRPRYSSTQSSSSHDRLVRSHLPIASEPPKRLSWKPKFESLDELLTGNLDDDDTKLDIKLGSSILFDNREKPEEIQEDVEEFDYYFTDDDLLNRRKIAVPHLIRNAVNSLFNENPHPTAYEMTQLSEFYSIKYRTIFDFMERERISRGIHCEKGDICCKIKGWIDEDNAPNKYQRLNSHTREILERELEENIRLRRRFELRHVHMILEKTNLTPAFVRAEYNKWKNRICSYNPLGGTIEEWRENMTIQQEALPMQTLRTLEQAYINKRYESSIKEWSTQELQFLSREVGLPQDAILVWFQKRRRAVDKLTSSRVLPRQTSDRLLAHDFRRGISQQKSDVLTEEFENNSRPEKWKMSEMASRLDIPVKTVENFFTKKRRIAKRREQWEIARLDVMKMPQEQLQKIEQVAADRRKTSAEYAKIAERIDVSYTTLTSFVNWRKSLKLRSDS